MKIVLIVLFLSQFVFGQIKEWLEPAYGLWAVGAVQRSQNYINSESEFAAAPFIFGGYGNLSIEANRLAYTFFKNGTWYSEILLQVRSHQFRDKSHFAGERKNGVEAGLQVGRHLPLGFVSRLAFLHDIAGTHGSYEFDAQIFRHDNLGPFRILSAIGAQWQTEKLTRYYFAFEDYKPRTTIVTELEVIATYPLKKFGLFAGTRIYFYGTEVTNSPIVNKNRIEQYFCGIGYYL